MAMLKVGWLVVLCMVVVAAVPYAAEAGITCPQVQRSLVPCFNYLKGNGALPGNCCGGVQSLNKAARTTPDRQQVCRCLQSSYTTIPAIKPPLAAGLPSRCGVNIPYKISPSTDCSKVK